VKMVRPGSPQELPNITKGGLNKASSIVPRGRMSALVCCGASTATGTFDV
jgi:hypothetical protein